MELTTDEIAALRQLAEKEIISSGVRARADLERLVALKLATSQSASMDTVIFTITDAGRDWLAAHG